MIEVCFWENNSSRLLAYWKSGPGLSYIYIYIFFFFFLKIKLNLNVKLGFPGDLDGKEYACNVGDSGSIPALGRSLGEGNNSPLQYSCLENPMDRD